MLHALRPDLRGLFGRTEVLRTYEELIESAESRALAGSAAHEVIRRTQEGVYDGPLLWLAVRERVARWRYVEVHTDVMQCREIGASEYLARKESVVEPMPDPESYVLEVDLRPFERGFPKLTSSDQIGRGVEFLNEHLCSRLMDGGGRGVNDLLEFLRMHEVNGRPLMLDPRLEEAELRAALDDALGALAEPGSEWRRELEGIGFVGGWGDTAARTAESMSLLAEVLDGPTPDNLARFLARVPMIFDIVIVTPHGYFGQANVLGKPDTGGQVVYILDQVRALERAMREAIRRQGLEVEPNIVALTRLLPEAGDTSCGHRVEPIVGTRNARILRVPFRDERGDVIPHWIPRFEVWPYLERFAREAERELIAEMGSPPDLVIGNYSDGNLVASLLADSLGVTQCNIAHALEKTKYPDSDLRWREQEHEHHFSCQFTADLIAMNTADFIITSTHQEIAGTDEHVGQYESYSSFTLPGLYRVVAGIDCFDPKFNIVSPGADPRVFFPFHEEARRPDALRRDVEGLVLGNGDPRVEAVGHLDDPDRPLLFAMSRLDPVKNMTGLLRWYGESPELQDRANLLLVGGTLDPDQSQDRAEQEEIRTLHAGLERYGLEGRARWVEMQTDKNTVGELYRFVADRRGAFVQPALFEAFGLTVIEAMSSGLPTFATLHGGPLEIVEDAVSGYHVDPTSDEHATMTIAAFLKRAEADPDHWGGISEAAIRRVEERFTWARYADRLLALSRIYGFWRHITSLEREETRRYLDMFYALMYRPRAATVARPQLPAGTPIAAPV